MTEIWFRRKDLPASLRKKIMRYVQKVMENIANYPDMLILADDTVPRGITYRALGELSGKVYAYLQSKGIGKEDMVMLYLPRGIQPVIAQLGVIRNGSAFLTVEDTYEPERVAFMKKDSDCKLVIDSSVWEEIQKLDPKEGFEETDFHDAAMAIYTSGSTGNPKGVLHEYGNFDRMIESTVENGESLFATEKDRFAMVAPMNFIAAQLILTHVLYYRIFTYVVSYDVVKNPMKIGMFFLKNHISGTFLTPSHIRHMKVKLPGLRFCVIGSEPANNVYMEGLTIHNCYLMSESGFMVSHFVIDRSYEQTPVGHCICDVGTKLVGEDGNEVPAGEEGEIAFENPYVRGYLNLPEETALHFRDGYYYTGDLAFRNENGEYVICGRLSDMVKVNGNRVEPGEIECVSKRELGLDFAACRIFQDARSTMVCLYYTAKALPCSDDEARERMARFLPYYMIPNAFVHLDTIPLKATGKMDRKALPKPESSDFLSSYEAPADEIETKLCAGFEKALNMEKIGATDDFYKLGGDSLAAMEVLTECDISGLNASDIFAGRTPREIAALWRSAHPDGNLVSNEELNRKFLYEPQPLMNYQTYMFDYQCYTPRSTMLNLNTMFKVNFDEISREKLVKAMNQAISNHPSLLTRFRYARGGSVEQIYDPTFAPDLQIERYDAFEFNMLKDDLVKPFKIINSRLYRCRIFDVEGQGYVFFDVHHTVFDGTSFQVLLGDILKSIYDMPLEPDYYYVMLHQQEEMLNSARGKEALEYYESVYGGNDFTMKPELDHNVRENQVGSYSVDLNARDAALTALEEQYGIGRNAFFNTVVLLALAIYNRRPNVQCSWTYSGRDDMIRSSMTGLLLKDLPIMLRLHRKDTVKELYQSIREQIAKDLAYSFYPYTTQNIRIIEDDRICFLYQRNIRDAGGTDLETVEIRQNASASENVFDVQVLDDSNGLGLMLDYAASLYDRQSVERFARIFVGVFEALLDSDSDTPVIQIIKDAEKRAGHKEILITWIK